MISVIKYSADKGVQTLGIDDIKTWDYECKENLWIDIYQTDVEENNKILKDIFKFHPLAIEDSLKYIQTDDSVHHPKIEDFKEYLFIVFNGLLTTQKSYKYKLFSLSCFLGHNFLVTVHNESGENTIMRGII